MRVLIVSFGDIAPQARAGDEAARYTQDLLDVLPGQADVAVFSVTPAAGSLDFQQYRDARGIRTFAAPGQADSVRWGMYVGSASDQARLTDHFTAALDTFQPDVVYFQQVMPLPGAIFTALARRDTVAVAMQHDHALLCPRLDYWRSDQRPCDGPANGLWTCAACLTARIPLGLADAALIVPERLGLLRRVERSLADSRHPLAPLFDRDRVIHTVILPALDGLIVPSHGLGERLALEGVPPAQVRHIPYGYPLLPHTPAPRDDFDDRFGIPGDALSIGYFGAYRADQGIAVLLRAASLLAEKAPRALMIRLHGHGEDDFAQRMIAWAAELPNVWVLAPPHPADAGDLVEQLDAVVVPGLRYEVQPRLIVEAFKRGKPVVASNRGGMAELLDGGRRGGRLFPAGDHAALADALLRLYSEIGLMDRLRETIPAVRSIDAHVADLLAYCAELLAAHTNG
ncbi:MAG: glycosyltransferase [Anaerolineae bacterium]|nr:glycosyltransferase [Anaerolineae bacterium]